MEPGVVWMDFCPCHFEPLPQPCVLPLIACLLFLATQLLPLIAHLEAATWARRGGAGHTVAQMAWLPSPSSGLSPLLQSTSSCGNEQLRQSMLRVKWSCSPHSWEWEIKIGSCHCDFLQQQRWRKRWTSEDWTGGRLAWGQMPSICKVHHCQFTILPTTHRQLQGRASPTQSKRGSAICTAGLHLWPLGYCRRKDNLPFLKHLAVPPLRSL